MNFKIVHLSHKQVSCKEYFKNMEAKIVKKEGRRLTIQVDIELCDEMLDTEEAIHRGINEARLLATEYALSEFDTDGTSIKVANKK